MTFPPLYLDRSPFPIGPPVTPPIPRGFARARILAALAAGAAKIGVLADRAGLCLVLARVALDALAFRGFAVHRASDRWRITPAGRDALARLEAA